jgi:signal transduction histidine kinase
MFDDPIVAFNGLRDELLKVKQGETFVSPEMWYNPHDVDPNAPDNRRCIRVVSFPIMDSNGQLQYVVNMAEDVTRRTLAEEALQEEHEHLRRLLDLHERNRKLVAYEIHDGVVQSLVSAKMLFETVLNQVATKWPKHDLESYQAALDLVGDAVRQARELMGGQRPPVLDEHGLLLAIEDLLSEAVERHGIDIEFEHDVQFTQLASPLETAFFRIVQESLTNACRHSRSEKVRIAVTQRDGRIRAEVIDWGVGFDPRQVAENCLGLDGLRQRVRLFGGELTVDSSPGEGTRITAELPLVDSIGQRSILPA